MNALADGGYDAPPENSADLRDFAEGPLRSEITGRARGRGRRRRRGGPGARARHDEARRARHVGAFAPCSPPTALPPSPPPPHAAGVVRPPPARLAAGPASAASGARGDPDPADAAVVSAAALDDAALASRRGSAPTDQPAPPRRALADEPGRARRRPTDHEPRAARRCGRQRARLAARHGRGAGRSRGGLLRSVADRGGGRTLRASSRRRRWCAPRAAARARGPARHAARARGAACDVARRPRAPQVAVLWPADARERALFEALQPHVPRVVCAGDEAELSDVIMLVALQLSPS
jgi:hypothetical protein